MKLYKTSTLLFLLMILWGCQQEISVKKNSFTAINPVSYTDVIYKTNRDTVFVSTFDGKIYEVIKRNTKQQTASVNDEIYAIAYNAEKANLYAATLNSGIVVINTKDGSIIKRLPLKETWAIKLFFNPVNGILATYDFKGNHYVWNTNEDFKSIKTPDILKQIYPKYIKDNGDIYFEGRGKVLVWNYKTNCIKKKSKISGQLIDVDRNENYLLLSGKQFSFYNPKADSTVFTKKHPNWPIYLANKDSILNVPLNLEITLGLMTTTAIYTSGLDKSLRKWDKSNGELLETYSHYRNTPSAMAIAEDESQLVVVNLGGQVKFQEL